MIYIVIFVIIAIFLLGIPIVSDGITSYAIIYGILSLIIAYISVEMIKKSQTKSGKIKIAIISIIIVGIILLVSAFAKNSYVDPADKYYLDHKTEIDTYRENHKNDWKGYKGNRRNSWAETQALEADGYDPDTYRKEHRILKKNICDIKTLNI